MHAAEIEAPSFLDLTARQWRFDAAVTACAFDAGEKRVAFALADGRLAVTPAADAEPAAARRRTAADSGRVTISPRRRPVPPLAPFAVDDGPLDLAAAGPDGFLAGGAAGSLVRITGAGLHGALATPLAGPVEAMTAIAGGDVLVAAAGLVVRCDGRSGMVRTILHYDGRAAALAVSPAAARLATATDAGLVVTVLDGTEDAAPAADRLLGDVAALAFAPDGRRLAAGLAAGGVALIDAGGPRLAVTARLGNYPAPVRSLAWSRDGRRLATGGAFRTIVWDVGAAEGTPVHAIETGQPRFLVTGRVALHPHRPLVAAGLENGAIVVAEIGRRDEFLLKAPGDGAVLALAWSSDGSTLAFGTEGGLAAVVGLPQHLFK